MAPDEGAGRAFAVEVATNRLPVSPFYGLLNGCKGHKTHRFENGGTNQIRKTGKWEVVLLQPEPQTLYTGIGRDRSFSLPEAGSPTTLKKTGLRARRRCVEVCGLGLGDWGSGLRV